MTDKRRKPAGAKFATAAVTVLFLLSALLTAINVSRQQFGRATFAGFCALYLLMVVRLAFDDWIHSDD